MDPVKKFRIFFWIIFVFLVLVIAAGSYYFISADVFKNRIIASKDEKIALQAIDLSRQAKLLEDASSQTAQDKESLTAENAQLKKDKDTLTAENNALKAGKTKALAYAEFFRYLNSIIETHGGFTGWTDPEFQTAKTKAEATGDTSFVSTVNWAWYDRDTPPFDRVLRTWKEIVSGIQNALK